MGLVQDDARAVTVLPFPLWPRSLGVPGARGPVWGSEVKNPMRTGGGGGCKCIRGLVCRVLQFLPFSASNEGGGRMAEPTGGGD